MELNERFSYQAPLEEDRLHYTQNSPEEERFATKWMFVPSIRQKYLCDAPCCPEDTKSTFAHTYTIIKHIYPMKN